MAEPEREGYIYIGDVSVDSGMIVIGDPLLILHGSTEDYAGAGYNISFEDVQRALGSKEATGFLEVGKETIAVASSTGYGDGAYPVFAKLDNSQHVVEVVIDMQMLDFQKQLFDR